MECSDLCPAEPTRRSQLFFTFWLPRFASEVVGHAIAAAIVVAQFVAQGCVLRLGSSDCSWRLGVGAANQRSRQAPANLRLGFGHGLLLDRLYLTTASPGKLHPRPSRNPPFSQPIGFSRLRMDLKHKGVCKTSCYFSGCPAWICTVLPRLLERSVNGNSVL